MKKILLLALIVSGSSLVQAQTTHDVGTSGFTFNPDTLNITAGDSVHFTLSVTHNAQEVSQATWSANGSTSNGGFSIPFGGGGFRFNTAGTFYYVCTNHVTMGMKGVIIVTGGVNVEDEIKPLFSLQAYPTRVEERLTLTIEMNASQAVFIQVINMLGEVVYTEQQVAMVTGKNTRYIDFSSFKSGAYFVRVAAGNEMKTLKVIR
jgi:plastocyanin